MIFLFSYKFWLILSLIGLILYAILGGLKFVNCLDAFKGYKNIFKSSKGKMIWKHILFFVGFPAILATTSNLYSLVSDNILNIVGVIISIMTSMLYAFMSIIDTKYEKISCEKDCAYTDYHWAKVVYCETIDVITCEILVSVFC